MKLTEYDESNSQTGKALSVSLDSSMELKVKTTIDERLLTVDTSVKPTSLWNWKILFRETVEMEADKMTPRYYKVDITVKDSAGNEESSEKGFLCVLPKMDYPYTVFPKYGEKIPVGTPLSGTCYDDDGIKSVKLSLCNVSGEAIAGKEDVYGEKEIAGANIYTWKMQNSIPTTGGAYILKVEVVDLNDKASSYIVNGTDGYLHDAQYREKALTVVDLTAPSVDISAKRGNDEKAKNVDFDIYTDVVDESGDFRVSVKVTDASQVRKVYLARVLTSAEPNDVAKLSEIDPKSGNVNCWDLSSDPAGIQFYNLYEYSDGEKLPQITRDQPFNVYDDFDNEFEIKRFYVYAENASGKTTVSFKSLLKEEDRPQITVSSPSQGSTLTVPFDISFDAYDFTGITDLTIKCSQNKKEIGEELKLPMEEGANREISIDKLSSEKFGNTDDFDSGSCTLTFTATDSYGNSATEKMQFYVDKDEPCIRNITATSATYKTGDTIEIRVEMSKKVSVSGGTPTLTLNNGGSAVYSGVDGNYMIFKYVVEDGQDTECLNCTTLNLNDATVVDDQNKGLEIGSFRATGAGSLEVTSTVKIDTKKPTVSEIKAITANGSYKAKDKIEIQVIFSENVEINGEPRLILNIEGKDRYAEYDPSHNGNSKNKAVFVYTVQPGDNTGNLACTGWNKNEAMITDSATGAGEGGKGNEFVFNDELRSWQQKLVIDTTPPQVKKIESSFTSNALSAGGCRDNDGTYYCNEGKVIGLDVTFSEEVKVSGTPSLLLNLSSDKTTAVYQSGSGSKKLSFTYTVRAGDNTDTDEILKITGIDGVIKDSAGNDLGAMTDDSSGTIKDKNSDSEKKIKIDTQAPGAPTISATENANATNTAKVAVHTGLTGGKTVGVTIKASGEIAADTYSYCWEENGITDSYSAYTDKIEKTFGKGENEGFYQEYNVRLKLKDKAGNESEFSEKRVFIIDTDKPKLTKASSSAVVDGKLVTSTTRSYTKGETIYVSLVFNKEVTASSPVTVTLNNGGTVKLATSATHIEGSADYYLTGKYTVPDGQEFSDNLKITEVTAESVKDCLNNKLNSQALNSSIIANGFENIDSFQEIKIDSVAPEISKVSSSTTDGWYTVGKIISITVEFSEPTKLVGANPTLTLSNGASAQYVSGSGTNSWIFNYEVKAGNGKDTGDSSKDTSYLKANKITGDIRDLAGEQNGGNPLNAAMPADNFSNNKIGIDTTPPKPLELKAVYSEGNNEIVENGKTVSGKNGGAYITVSCASQEPDAVVYITENGNVKSNWEASPTPVTCRPGDGEVLTYTIAAKQRDRAGNSSAESSVRFTIDNSPIKLESITTSHENGPCTSGAVIELNLNFNKEVRVKSSSALTLTAITKDGVQQKVPIEAVASTANKTVKAVYTVVAGDTTPEVLNVSKLTGEVTDELNTSLNLSEVDISTITNLAADKQITIDTEAPTITGITTTAANGWYGAGKRIQFTMKCNEDVTIVGTPALNLSNGGKATFVSGAGSENLAFDYIVGSGDTSTTSQSLEVSGFSETIQDIAGNDLLFSNTVSFAIGIDTVVPGKLTIGGITNNGTVTNAQNLEISGFGETGGSGIKSYTININGTSYEVDGSVSGKLMFNNLPQNIKNKLTVASGGKQSFAISVYQTDNAGNKSAVSNTLNFTIDTNKAKLVSVASSRNNQVCKEGETVEISLVFSRRASGSLAMTLSNGVTLNSGSWLPDGMTYTASYKIGDVSSEDTGGKNLTITEITGTINDTLESQSMENLWSKTVAFDLSSYKVVVDTVAPTGTGSGSYDNSTGTATLTYTFSEDISKVAGKKVTLTRDAKAAPIVLSVSEYNELYALSSSIGTYYEKTINGWANNKVDSTAKYVLKYNYGPTESSLVNILKSIGYYKQEIVMESSAVTVSGKTITVKINGLMTGERYTVTADSGIVKDSVGHSCASIGEITFDSGNKPQAPVIRVNKISGRGTTADSTTMRIDTVTDGVTIKYSMSSSFTSSPTTSYGGNDSVTWRGQKYNGVKISSTTCISAKAEKGGASSDVSYEKAFKTVIQTAPTYWDDHKDSNNSIQFFVFRGGDQSSGSNSVSGFPMTWDEKSVSDTWSNSTVGDNLEELLAGYGMLLAENKTATTWGVMDTLYFHGLGCKVYGNKLVWKWQEQAAISVSAGGTGTDTNKLEAKFHDRAGANID